MPNKTVNYGLIKPLATEYYDVNIQNGNMDVIDREIKNINDISNKKISELDSKINDMKVSEFKTDVLKKFEEVDGRTSTLEKSMFTVAGNVVDLQTNNAFAVTRGTSTAYTVTLNPAPVAYKDGMQITIVPHINSLSNPTLSVNGLNPLLIVDDNLQPVTLKKDIPVSLVRVGNYFFTRKGQSVNQKDIKKIIDDINAGITDTTKNLGYQVSYSDPVNVNRNDVTVINGSENNTDSRKIVRLINRWLVFCVRESNTLYRFFISKDNGGTWSKLCTWEASSNDRIVSLSLCSKGNFLYYLITLVNSAGFKGALFGKINVENIVKDTNISYTSVDIGDLSSLNNEVGSCSLTINPQGTELHACWASVSSNYYKSSNIRYVKGIINTDGSVTWGSLEQVTNANSLDLHLKSPTISVTTNNNVVIAFKREQSGSYGIEVAVRTNCFSWKTMYSGGSYVQDSPCSIFVPNSNMGRLWTTWHGIDSVDVNKSNIRVSYSDDGGITWSTPTKLTSGNTIDRKNPSITANMKTGEVHILYEDGTGISKITWNGTSWGVPTNVITTGTNPSTYYDNSIQAQDFSSPIFMYKATNKIGFYGTWNDSIATETINYSKVTVQDIIGYINSSGRLDTPTITADDKLIFYQNNISKYSESRVYIEAFRFNSLVNGSFKLSFSLANYNAYGYASLRINGIEYKNYMVVDESQDLIENITIKKNDLVQIFVKAEGNGSTFTGVNVGSYKITGDIEAFKNIYI